MTLQDRIYVDEFERVNDLLEPIKVFLVVKSQDQIERRERMLESRKGEKFGRIKPRPTATGLLVSGWLEDAVFRVEWKREFREPRHIQPLRNGEYLLTEINRVLELNSSGEVLDSYSHPFFGFLHTVDIRSDGERILIASAGYDSVFELDLSSGEETFRWFAWYHGFNPDEDGYWLAADKIAYEKYQLQGRKVLLIDPAKYGEQGLVTARRSAHPNVAVYDPFDDEKSMIVSIGHNGELYRVRLADGKTELVSDALSQMPHGLMPFQGGWMITNTTRGEWWLMDDSFQVKTCYSLVQLGGKVSGTEEVEWVQQVVPVGDSRVLALDANRGLIAIDLASECYSFYQPDQNWCIQDALCIS